MGLVVGRGAAVCALMDTARAPTPKIASTNLFGTIDVPRWE